MLSTRNPAGIASLLGSIAASLLAVSGAAAAETALPVEIPLHDDGATIRVPVKMFGKTLYFGLDTGSSSTVLNAAYQNELGDPVADAKVDTPHSRGSDAKLYACPELTVGGLPVGLSRIACLDLSLLQRITGEQWDGVLGIDFLQNHIVSFDFEKGRIVFESEVPAEMKSAGMAVPLTRAKATRLAVAAEINGRPPIALMLDTGDNASLSLNVTDWDAIVSKDRETPIQKTLMAGASHKVSETSFARLRSVKIGSRSYPDLLCALTPNAQTPSTLGLQFFRRHFVTIDFPNAQLYMRPNASFAQPDKPDMSGLHLLRHEAGILAYAVDKGSPSEQAGVQAGDVILSLNDKPAAGVSMRAAREALQTRDGAEVTLEVARGVERRSVSFRLRQGI